MRSLIGLFIAVLITGSITWFVGLFLTQIDENVTSGDKHPLSDSPPYPQDGMDHLHVFVQVGQTMVLDVDLP